MRRTPPTIHLLAATDTASVTATATTAATMSSRSPQRGRRGRGFSGRSYSGGRGQFVSGDAHFRSVRDANLGFRRGERESFANQTQLHQSPPYNPRPSQPPQHRHTPQFRQPQPQYRPPPQSDNRREFRPPLHLRPRPPDYRDWELALTPPPPSHCARFKVLSYNILADYLALDHRNKLYRHIPPYMLDWQWRKGKLIFELGLWSADIMCLQEVDRFHELAEELKLKGYNGIWKMRTGNPVDGCAIFWRTSRFKLLYEECIEFNKLGLRDNVAQVCVLELIKQDGYLPSSLMGSSKVVVCNIHVLYNPNRGEIKLGQVRVLLDKAKAVSEVWNDAPVVICGDFNCTPKSPLYNFISERKLDLSEIDRDKVSGQASAIIRTPKLYGPNSSERSAAIGSVQLTSTEVNKEVIEKNNYFPDMQNPETKSNNFENQFTHTLECAKESDAYAGKDTQETAVDHSKIFNEVDSIKEESGPSYGEGMIRIDHINYEVQDSTPVTSSAMEAVHSDTAEMDSNEHLSDAVPTSNKELLSKKSDLHLPEGNKQVNFDCPSTSSLEANLSSMYESTDLVNAEISSSKPTNQTSVSNAFEGPHTVYGDSSSCEVIANEQNNSSSISCLGHDVSDKLSNISLQKDEKLEKSFLDEMEKEIPSSESFCEDDNAFISALHNAEGVTLDLGPSMKSDIDNSQQNQIEELDPSPNNFLLPVGSNEVEDDLSPSQTSISPNSEKNTYNPSLWTHAEIETATGNAECTYLEHPLALRSTYTEAMDSSGTRDPHGEPMVTSYNRCFSGTVDYIWRSEGLQTTRVLAPMSKHAMEWTAGFPTKKWGSDHIALVSELAFLKDGADFSTGAK